MILAYISCQSSIRIAHAASFEVASIKPAAVSKTTCEGSGRARIEYTPDSLTMRSSWG
jgi:hypothetical protein